MDVTSIQFFTPFTTIDIIPTKHLTPGATKASLREVHLPPKQAAKRGSVHYSLKDMLRYGIVSVFFHLYSG